MSVALALTGLGCQAFLGDFEVADVAATDVVIGTACRPNAFRCTGSDLETCAENRQGFVRVETCGAGLECDPSAGACRVCKQGEYACNEAILERCDASGHFTATGDVCATPELCSVSGDRTQGLCVSPACDAGALRCDANHLVRCAPGRDHWLLIDRCASVPLCDNAAAQAELPATAGRIATCRERLCLPGSFACDGAKLERCSGDQDAWETVTTCSSPSACNPADGSCAPATPGVTACSGAELVKSTANGFVHVADCGTPELCDAANGACQPASCGTPGTLRCGKTDPTLEECRPDGQWVTREVCASGRLCSVAEARCLPAACELGAQRCVGKDHQICSDDRSHFRTDRTCGAQEACTLDGCDADQCDPNGLRCVAETLEACSDGHWVPQLRCATSALCDTSVAGGRCKEPACGGSKGDYACDDSHTKLLTCPPGRDAWSARTCDMAPALLCDETPSLGTGTPDCDVCNALDYSCSGSELHRCAADGQSNPTIALCPGGCSANGTTGTCMP